MSKKIILLLDHAQEDIDKKHSARAGIVFTRSRLTSIGQNAIGQTCNHVT